MRRRHSGRLNGTSIGDDPTSSTLRISSTEYDFQPPWPSVIPNSLFLRSAALWPLNSVPGPYSANTRRVDGMCYTCRQGRIPPPFEDWLTCCSRRPSAKTLAGRSMIRPLSGPSLSLDNSFPGFHLRERSLERVLHTVWCCDQDLARVHARVCLGDPATTSDFEHVGTSAPLV